MTAFLWPFLAALVLITAIQLNTAFIADRSWFSVALQPLIALSWCVGISGVVKGPWGIAGYVLGSTLGATLVAFWRVRGRRG